MLRRPMLTLLCAGLFLVGCRAAIDPQANIKLSHAVEPQQASVVSLAFSPDGERLASVHAWVPRANSRSLSYPVGFVKYWELYEQRPRDLAKIQVETSHHQKVLFSPDGKDLVIRSGKKLFRWDIERKVLDEAPFQVVTTVSPDSQWMEIVPPEQDVPLEQGALRPPEISHIVDTSTYRVRHQLSYCTVWAYSPDASMFIVQHDHSGQLEIRDFATGKKKVSLQDQEGGYLYLTFSPDGTRLAGVSRKTYSISLWDTSTGERVAHTAQVVPPQHGFVWDLAFSPNGRMLAIGSELPAKDQAGVLTLWDVERGVELKKIVDDSVWGITAVAFRPDGKKLAVGNSAGKIQIWDVPSPDTSEND